MPVIDLDFICFIDARNIVQLGIRLSMVYMVLCVAAVMPTCLAQGLNQILSAPLLVVETLAFLVGHP